jgi:hypothetical protein
MFIVVWMTKESRGVYRDHSEAHESRALAESQFAALLLRDDVYSVNLCGVIKSTDYEPAQF